MKKVKKQFTAADVKHTIGLTADQLKQIQGAKHIGNVKYNDF